MWRLIVALTVLVLAHSDAYASCRGLDGATADLKVRQALTHLNGTQLGMSYDYADCATSYLTAVNGTDISPEGRKNFETLLKRSIYWFSQGRQAAGQAKDRRLAETYAERELDAHKALINFWVATQTVDLGTPERRQLIVSSITEYGYAAERQSKGKDYVEDFLRLNSPSAGATASLTESDSAARDLLVKAVASCESWNFKSGANSSDDELRSTVCSASCRDYASQVVSQLKGARKFSRVQFGQLRDRLEQATYTCQTAAQ